MTKSNPVIQPDFNKGGGLVPAVVQDADTKVVLMLAYMNAEALEQTYKTGKVCFFSRSKNRLWTKGETSGHFLELVDILSDCDQDSLLILARPRGPVCHTGTDTCFAQKNQVSAGTFLGKLETLILQRRDHPSENSYTKSLFDKGIQKIAQKVGEEAVETILEVQSGRDDLFLNESADLLYHFLVLLAAKNYSLREVENILEIRNKKKA